MEHFRMRKLSKIVMSRELVGQELISASINYHLQTV